MIFLKDLEQTKQLHDILCAEINIQGVIMKAPRHFRRKYGVKWIGYDPKLRKFYKYDT